MGAEVSGDLRDLRDLMLPLAEEARESVVTWWALKTDGAVLDADLLAVIEQMTFCALQRYHKAGVAKLRAPPLPCAYWVECPWPSHYANALPTAGATTEREKPAASDREWATANLKPWEVERVIQRLVEARQEGEIAMRERAAQIADSEAEDYKALYVLEGFSEDLKRRDAAERIARRVRALELS